MQVLVSFEHSMSQEPPGQDKVLLRPAVAFIFLQFPLLQAILHVPLCKEREDVKILDVTRSHFTLT